MLAEKFFLLLETLRSHTETDGSQRVVSTSPHIPLQIPEAQVILVYPSRADTGRRHGLNS
ncbi:hypothetical protein CWO89_18270 [Bradyrhizobium sp. Leo170]|nr:hypothetical protein CWO89_18270 [Bradyrhizobium sp. Leo170]